MVHRDLNDATLQRETPDQDLSAPNDNSGQILPVTSPKDIGFVLYFPQPSSSAPVIEEISSEVIEAQGSNEVVSLPHTAPQDNIKPIRCNCP
jgi:hypothetical protein